MLLPEGLLRFRKHTIIYVSRHEITQNTPQASLTVNCSYSITLNQRTATAARVFWVLATNTEALVLEMHVAVDPPTPAFNWQSPYLELLWLEYSPHDFSTYL